MNAVEVILWVVAGVLCVPCAVLFVECVASLFLRGRCRDDEGGHARYVIVVPAHDEETIIVDAVHHMMGQLSARGRLLVVADNCTDRTAELARGAGAQVAERIDPERRGKGYAMGHAVKQLSSDPPDVVLFVDVDCTMPVGAAQRLCDRAMRMGRPVQAIYKMEMPRDATPRDAVSALAFAVKVSMRQRGLAALGAPCQLSGTGMAWPWEATRAINLETGALTEDERMGLELAIAGFPPVLAPDITVTSQLPRQESAARTQRVRWEQGHLQTMVWMLPRLLFESLRRLSPGLLVSALDVSIPPLSLLVALLVTGAAVAGWAVRAGASPNPFWVLAGGLALVVVSALIGWLRFARNIPITGLLAAPLYIVWKVPIYFGYIFRPEKRWVRTERDEREPKP